MVRYFKALSTQSIWLQLLFFSLLTAGSLILFSALGQLLCIVLYGYPMYQAALPLITTPSLMVEDGMEIPDALTAIMAISQISSQLGLFIVPPLLMMTLTWTPKTPDYQVFITRPGMFQSLLLFPLLFIMLPLVAWLTKVNMDISLPDLLIRSEEDAGLIIEHFFNHQGIGRFALNMVMIALIPAIGEELFFRGILQQYLARGIKNVHLAVLISAFIFSFFHFQFQGFIPRMGLGMLFGYLLVWSGSIWLPVLAHFINNGSAVLVEFLYQRGEIQTGHQEFGTNTTPVVVIISTIATFTLCYLIYKGRSASEAPNEPSRIE